MGDLAGGKGGYVVSKDDGSNWVSSPKDITREQLLEIAKILKIPEGDREKLISGTRSIYIYRGKGGGGGSGSY
jgi:hypothetical protein